MKTTTSSATIQLLILLTLTSIPIPTSFAHPYSPDITTTYSGAASPPPPIPSSTYSPDGSYPPPISSTYSPTTAYPPPIPAAYPPPIPAAYPQPIPTTYTPSASYPPPIPTSNTGAATFPPPIPTTSTGSASYPPIPTSNTGAASYPPPIPPQSTGSYKPSIFSTVLNQLGYPALAAAAAQANLSTAIPTTIFAPSDSSLLTCPTCSLPLLLQEHSLPGLYSLHYLRSLAFGTKIETLAPNRCLTITATISAPTAAAKKIFINGVEISKPDLFNDGFLIIHGLQGFVTHLSPDSCLIERQTSLAFPSQPLPTAEFHLSRMMLKEAMMRLRVSGYSVVALAMRVKYWELCDLKGLTIFALDDASIFAGGIGHAYVADIGYHIVPNRVLMGADLEGMPPLMVLPTMERWQSLVVTTASGGGPMVPMRINYVKIKCFDLVHNSRIVVHGLSMPFPHVEDPRKYA